MLNSKPQDTYDSTTTWYKWLLKTYTYAKKTKTGTEQKTSKKISKELVTGTVAELIEEYKNDIQSLKKHYFNIDHQHHSFKHCIETLKDDEVAIICDFSESYNSKLAQEVQSNHWSNEPFTLHTGIIYTKDYKPISFCSISPSNAHAYLGPPQSHI